MQAAAELRRVQAQISGAVQGIGFRPHVFRLASSLGLCGWVCNSTAGVLVEVEGTGEQVDAFFSRLRDDAHIATAIHCCECRELPVCGDAGFEIHESTNGPKIAAISPDLATCHQCLSEIRNPNDRRFRYPFTNCTHCGPRYTIVESIPYDRQNTTMKHFQMCAKCEIEYRDPFNRRFHAQPNACPECGPQLQLWGRDGKILARGDNALLACANAIREGMIAAVKGLGGFHLFVDARDERAVKSLRERKHRLAKPLAVMFPSLKQIRGECVLAEAEEQALLSAQAPIVLLEQARQLPVLAAAVAPDVPCLGAMLPYTPLHHLLMDELDFPVVATSGNLSEEPICTDEAEALQRLGKIADLFLVHNRPIERAVDDSVARVIEGRPMLLRRARGYAPLPVYIGEPLPPLLAVGGHQKNTVALTVENQLVLSQHIGDLDSTAALAAFEKSIDDLARLYERQPVAIVRDLHPDYKSTQYAYTRSLPGTGVQHQHAHIFSCMAEHGLAPPVLGVAWDGTGWGTDGTIWGGEFFKIDLGKVERVGRMRRFHLPGGEQAIKEPRRSSFGLLYELGGDCAYADLPVMQSFSESDRANLHTMIEREINAPRTSSAGRLFDGVAALLDLSHEASFEGAAAMALEAAAMESELESPYSVTLSASEGMLEIDWRPMLRQMIAERGEGVPVSSLAARFHNWLAEVIVTVAQRADIKNVALSGGCFQNAVLLRRTILRLRDAGFTPYWQQQVPCNDGGLALGQLASFIYASEATHVPGDSREAD